MIDHAIFLNTLQVNTTHLLFMVQKSTSSVDTKIFQASGLTTNEDASRKLIQQKNILFLNLFPVSRFTCCYRSHPTKMMTFLPVFHFPNLISKTSRSKYEICQNSPLKILNLHNNQTQGHSMTLIRVSKLIFIHGLHKKKLSYFISQEISN